MNDYKQFVISLAQQAGKIIQDNFSLSIKKEWKPDSTPLTIADTAVNHLVISEVKKHFPTHGILAEEESNMKDDAQYLWVCDPIDGTFPFAHGIPTSTFSLALTKQGEVILGVLYDPFLKRMFFAEKGKGAYLNDKKTAVSNNKTLHQAVVTLEDLDSSRWNYGEVMRALEKKKTRIISFAACTYGTTLVASGQIAATIFAGTNPWDGAAVKIIVEEAGGKVTNLLGEEQLYDRPINGFVASNGLVHEELIKLTRQNITPGLQ
jgi:myo-inositol-1(or 4)-monophosphatase